MHWRKRLPSRNPKRVYFSKGSLQAWGTPLGCRWTPHHTPAFTPCLLLLSCPPRRLVYCNCTCNVFFRCKWVFPRIPSDVVERRCHPAKDSRILSIRIVQILNPGEVALPHHRHTQTRGRRFGKIKLINPVITPKLFISLCSC